jgi:lipopolysaccharide transport system permease protein
MLAKLRRYRDIVLYRIWAQLKTEARQNYLGFIWFALEPALMTVIFFLVFGVILEEKTTEYLWFLVFGLTAWQWFETALNEGMMGLKIKLHILSQIPLPKQIFPLVHVGAATSRFLCFFVLLLTLHIVFNAGTTLVLLWILPVMLVQLGLVIGLTWMLAVGVCYFEDLQKVTQAITRLLFYLSGIFFMPERVPADLQEFFYMNPLAILLKSYRDVIIYHQAPQMGLLGYAAIWAIGFMLIGFWVCKAADKKLMREVVA